MDEYKVGASEKTRAIKRVFVPFTLFFVVWTLLTVYIRPKTGDIVEGVLWAGDFLWIAASALLLFRDRAKLAIPLKRVFFNKIDWQVRFLLLFCIIPVYPLFLLLLGGMMHITPVKLWRQAIYCVVFLEAELLFRGWMYNRLSAVIAKWKANLLSAAMYALIFIPEWMLSGYAPIKTVIFSLAAFSFGVFAAYSFEKEQTIRVTLLERAILSMFYYLFVYGP